MNGTIEGISKLKDPPSEKDSDSAKSRAMKAIRIHKYLVKMVTRAGKWSYE